MKKYRFGDEMFNCKPNDCPGWKTVPTIHGLCCTFNFHPNNAFNAYALNQFGKHSGMSIVFNGTISTNSLSSTLMIHYPSDYVTKATQFTPLSPGYETFIRIYSHLNEPSNQYMNLPLESRRCLLPQDKNLTLFRQSRCRLICFTKVVHKKCGCHPYSLPILENSYKIMKNCTPVDIPCFDHNFGEKIFFQRFLIFNRLNDDFSAIWNEQCPDCMPSCFEISYRLSISDAVFNGNPSTSVALL